MGKRQERKSVPIIIIMISLSLAWLLIYWVVFPSPWLPTLQVNANKLNLEISYQEDNEGRLIGFGVKPENVETVILYFEPQSGYQKTLFNLEGNYFFLPNNYERLIVGVQSRTREINWLNPYKYNIINADYEYDSKWIIHQ